MNRVAQSAIAIGALLCAGPAAAQFGGPFDAPRPPGSVPVRPQAQPQYPPPPQYQPQPQYQPPPPIRPGAVQSEDLPAPGSAQGGVQPATPSPSNRQQRPGLPPLTEPAAAAPAPPQLPAEAVAVTPPPPQRITNPTAVFSGLDKITGRITNFQAAIGETVQFGALQVTARACYSRPPTETPLTDGFVEVDEVTLQGDVKRIFTGWMFAASPGLHAVEHAVYDIWLVDCKGGAQVTADTQPTTSAAAPSRQPSNSQQRQGASQQRQQPRQPGPPTQGR